jgi:oligopeptide transport system substrate-binding protein
MRIRKRVAWASVPVLAMIGLAACSSSGGSSGSSSGATNPNGIVSIGIGEPQHLLPSNSTDTNGFQVLVSLYTPLVSYDSNNKPVPEAATSITPSEGSKVWDIKLNPAYKFSNGDPVTAQDYINAWNYAAYAPNGQGTNYYFSGIAGYAAMNPANVNAKPTATTLSGLKAVSPTDLQVTLAAPDITFETQIGYSAFFPLPTQAFTSSGAIVAGFEDHLIGDGPYKMTAAGWQHNKEIDVVKTDTFGGPVKPKVGGIDFKSYLNLSTAYKDVQTNTLDVLPNPTTADLANAQSDFGSRYQHSPTSAFQFLAFPTYDKDYSNVNVRKAISMAIDRDAIIRTVFSNTQTSARSFVSPVLPGYRPNVCGTACDYNPTAAKALYVANNGPKQLQITYNADGGHQEWVEATCNQLQQNLGVPCLAKAVPDFPTLLDDVQKKQAGIGMFRLGWVMDYPSMGDYLGPLYSTHGSSNYYGYSNPAFDALVLKAQAEPTLDQAIAVYQQAENILAQDLPVIPLRFGQNNFVFSTYVHNVSMDLFANVNLLTITTTRS